MERIIFSGFGGQGILFAGKLLAYGAMTENKEVSWIPSYGPEMRGGTANCSVIISDEPVSSPVISNPDYLAAMNLPSFERFKDAVTPGGKIFIDSSMISERCERTDTEYFYVPATELALVNGIRGMANIILCGKIIRETNVISPESAENAFRKIVSKNHADLIDSNLKALEIGMNIK